MRELESANRIAAAPDFEDDFDDIVDVRLRVDGARDGEVSVLKARPAKLAP